MLKQYLASQLSRPAGSIGKYILGRLWNKRNAVLNDVTLKHLDLKEDDRVLDVGFGGGRLIEIVLPNVQKGFVAGIDVSRVLVENCKVRYKKAIREGRVDVQCGKAEEIPYPDDSFTKACSVNSLFYWSDVRQGISEMHRILLDSGKIVLTFTSKEDLKNKWFVRYGVNVFEEEEVRQFLSDAGFQNIQSTRHADRHREFICMSGYK